MESPGLVTRGRSNTFPGSRTDEGGKTTGACQSSSDKEVVMSNCTSTGVSGTAISLATNPIPEGVLVTLVGYAQSANGQTATVTDTNGNTVASISSSGTSEVRW